MDVVSTVKIFCTVVLLSGTACQNIASELIERETCEPIHPAGVQFSLKSFQNLTGHWISEVQLEHESDTIKTNGFNMGKWQADVRQDIMACETGRRIVLTATIIAPPPVPGPGYVLIPGHGYYKVHLDPLPWEEARRSCIREGAHLLILNSQAEAQIVKELCSQHSDIDLSLYVGLHDLNTEGQFQTITGEPARTAGFLNWMAGEPSNSYDSGEDCVVLLRNALQLNDVSCTRKYPYVCEQSL